MSRRTVREEKPGHKRTGWVVEPPIDEQMGEGDQWAIFYGDDAEADARSYARRLDDPEGVCVGVRVEWADTANRMLWSLRFTGDNAQADASAFHAQCVAPLVTGEVPVVGGGSYQTCPDGAMEAVMRFRLESDGTPAGTYAVNLLSGRRLAITGFRYLTDPKVLKERADRTEARWPGWPNPCPLSLIQIDVAPGAVLESTPEALSGVCSDG